MSDMWMASSDAEQSVLGAILMNPKALSSVMEILRPDDFFEVPHAALYGAMLDMDNTGRQPTAPAMAAYLSHHENLSERVGGQTYLARLSAAAIPRLAVDHARLVRDLSARRALVEACGIAIADAREYGAREGTGDVLERLEARLTDLALDQASGSGPTAISGITAGVVAKIEEMQKSGRRMLGVPTGLKRLDRLLSGLQPGQLVLVGARPSMGKSVLGENVARRVAMLPVGPDVPPGCVAFFSLEMTAEEVGQRGLADMAGVPFHLLRRGELSHGGLQQVAMASAELGQLPLFVDDTPGLGVAAIRSRARRLARKHGGMRLMVVDHLHLVSGHGGENRNTELANITKALKVLAKELCCAVVLLAQLSRKVEEREDKRPQLQDLRESGAIEQDADVVMFLFREQYYLERAEPRRTPTETDEKYNDRQSRYMKRLEEVWNTCEIIVAKQRNGPVGTVRLGFEGQYARFFNIDVEEVGEHG
ncbi:MAG: replicative DNA helicase [Alphaproteobacteria bacterium]|nr:replicative DNA helicase [Alphaproteobacteria bacterium]